MISLYQIYESVADVANMSGDELIKNHKDYFQALMKAQRACSSAIRKLDARGSFPMILLSGRKKTDPWFKKEPSSDRPPKDSDKVVDAFVEKYRKKHHSQIASRQKAIFCYPTQIVMKDFRDLRAVIHYGKPYVILPINGSKYFQSKDIEDLFGSAEYVTIRRALLIKKPPDQLAAREIIGKYFAEGIIDLSQINLYKEIIVEHKGYYAFSVLQWRMFLKKFDIKDSDIFGKQALDVLKQHGIG